MLGLEKLLLLLVPPEEARQHLQNCFFAFMTLYLVKLSILIFSCAV